VATCLQWAKIVVAVTYSAQVFYSERKRLAAIAAGEAQGESFWTSDLDSAVRGKLVDAYSRTVPQRARTHIEVAVTKLITRETGNLAPSGIQECLLRGNEVLVLTYLEMIHWCLVGFAQRPLGGTLTADYDSTTFAAEVNRIFNAHRVAFRFVDGDIVPLSSDELHVEVVEPTLRLLHGRKDFDKAHEAYLKSLKEISNDDAPDAITDAGTALQETLTALGCQGNQLGDLLKDAKKRGLLGVHDQKLINGIESFGSWASAERSQSGDAHKSSDAVLADAWLMVHIVGALIVRLADPKLRHGQGASTPS
jgi:hypothetical protein